MGFVSDFTDDFSDAFGVIAESATIAGNSGLAVVSIDDSPDRSAAGNGRSDWATITVMKSSVSKPYYRMQVTVDGVTWRVASWTGDGIFWDLKCTSDERVGR